MTKGPDRLTPPLFTGTGVALLTLFDERGDLLIDETAEFAAALVDEGAGAVLVGGTTGEFWTLEDGERHELTLAVRTRAGPRVPVIEQVGTVSAQRTLSSAKGVAAAGPDAVMCMVSPDTTAGDLLPQVRDRIGDLPLLAYHFPAVGFAPVTVEDLADLPVDGIKDSSGDADRLAATAHVPLPSGVYTGSPLLLARAEELGAAGALLALGNLEPATTQAAWNGDADAARRMAQLHRQLSAAPPPQMLKQLAAQRWGTPPWTRDPTLAGAWDR